MAPGGMFIVEITERSERRDCRSYTSEITSEIVDRCRVGDRSIAEMARALGLTVSAVSRWVGEPHRSLQRTGHDGRVEPNQRPVEVASCQESRSARNSARRSALASSEASRLPRPTRRSPSRLDWRSCLATEGSRTASSTADCRLLLRRAHLSRQPVIALRNQTRLPLTKTR